MMPASPASDSDAPSIDRENGAMDDAGLRNARYGVLGVCVGSGQGVALVLENTAAVIEFLTKNKAVDWVLHPCLESHPDFALAKRLLPKGAGSIISCGIKGGRAAGKKFIEGLRLASHLANVGDAKGFVVARNLGLVDALEVFLYKLKPETVYNVYVGDQRTPVAAFKTNAMGMANGTVIGPLREVVSTLSAKTASPSNIVVMEGDAAIDPAKAVLVSST